jgi:hypothetical protein
MGNGVGVIEPSLADNAIRFFERTNRRGSANSRQDEQDLQDGFRRRPTGAIDSFQLNPSSLLHPDHPVHPVENGFGAGKPDSVPHLAMLWSLFLSGRLATDPAGRAACAT